MKRPIGIDLFSGAGGLSLGFEQAGFDVVAAVEVDPVHAAVHAYNFPRCAVMPLSVQDIGGKAIRKAAGIGNRKVDVVFGGAPCQGFSLIGARALDDPRNALVRDFVRIVSELDANYFVFENVKGITLGEHSQILRELVSDFVAIGYEIRLPWKVLNAAQFCVPQTRERLILVGCKRGLTLPDYPAPVSRAAGTKGDLGSLPEGPSCRDALGDLPDAESFLELLEGDAVEAKWGRPCAYARAMRGLSNDADGYGYQREWNPKVLTCSTRTDHTAISRRRFAATKEGRVEPISRFFKLSPTGVSNTLRAGSDGARGAFTSPRPIHYKHPRCITVREMARLHGFPDWFRFQVTKWHGARQVGNAVPPPLARAIAANVMKATAYSPLIPTETVKLGDEALLAMNAVEAAAHFGIEAASGKRDRKGAPKRRQWDDMAVNGELFQTPFTEGTSS
jgi:DNA (cytosine-5)-methyltransferase 1